VNHPARGRPADLSLVHEHIIRCNRCDRLRSYCQQIAREKRAAYRTETYWGKPVPGFGDPQARVLVLGLAPAAHGANRTGRVFTGDGTGGSGDFLMRAMHAAGFASIPTSQRIDDGLALHDAFIAAVVRCAPPDNKPSPQEIAACEQHLTAEVAALPRVRVIVCLGRIAFDAVWRLLARKGLPAIRPKPAFTHGAVYHPDDSHTVIASYHPSRQNTNTNRLTERMLADVFTIAAESRLSPLSRRERSDAPSN
jgi:uracil-DNA glycosylase family 4